MGPRLFSRGNVALRATVKKLTNNASMGPRLFSRGNVAQHEVSYLKNHASMGPRLFSRGNSGFDKLVSDVLKWLQWGHDFSAVEMQGI